MLHYITKTDSTGSGHPDLIKKNPQNPTLKMYIHNLKNNLNAKYLN